MPPIAVCSKLVAPTGRRPELLAALAELTAAARDEPGTRVYCVHVDRDDDDRVWLYELYVDDDALATHRDSPAVEGFVARLGDLVAERPEITFGRPISSTGIP